MKNSKDTVQPILFAILFASIPWSALNAAPPPVKQPFVLFPPTVESVGDDSLTVQTAAKAGFKVTDADGHTCPPSNIETIKVDSSTVITIDGLKGQLKDIIPGMIVDVFRGLDRDTAKTIDAHTVPPPAPPKARVGAISRKIAAEQILNVTPQTITVGQPGAKRAVAYQITPLTAVEIDGSKDAVSNLRVGMKVAISRFDGTTAATIVAWDGSSH